MHDSFPGRVLSASVSIDLGGLTGSFFCQRLSLPGNSLGVNLTPPPIGAETRLCHPRGGGGGTNSVTRLQKGTSQQIEPRNQGEGEQTEAPEQVASSER